MEGRGSVRHGSSLTGKARQARNGRVCHGVARSVAERSVRVRHGIAGSLTAWRGGAGGARNGVAL